MSKLIKLSIPAMKCGGCVSAIEKALDGTDGVVKSEVDLASKSASIESDASLLTLLDAIKAAGFDAAELPGDGQELPA